MAVLVPSITDSSSIRLALLAAVVIARVSLSDLQAHLNGSTVGALLKNDVREFVRLVGVRFDAQKG